MTKRQWLPTTQRRLPAPRRHLVERFRRCVSTRSLPKAEPFLLLQLLAQAWTPGCTPTRHCFSRRASLIPHANFYHAGRQRDFSCNIHLGTKESHCSSNQPQEAERGHEAASGRPQTSTAVECARSPPKATGADAASPRTTGSRSATRKGGDETPGGGVVQGQADARQ